MVKKQENIPQWIETEQKEIIQTRKANLEEKGFKELFNFPQGTTVITIDQEKHPRAVTTMYGPKKILRIKVDNQEKDLMISESSPLWRDIINKLASGVVTIQVIRAGLGKTTRYSVL